MEPTKPNIVLVITDDQGYGDLGCHGNTVIQTPHIDALHAQSVRFLDYHVGPTCAPTRAGLMTGRYHNSTGVWHTIGGRSLLRSDETSLATMLRGGGYRTGIFGKWHLGDNYPYRPLDRGFDEAVVHGGGGIGQTPDYWGNDYFDDTYFANGQARPFEGYCTDVFFQQATDFIQRNQDRPFFCYIPTNAPHSPYRVPERYAAPYLGQVPEERARFYGMISNIDENVGALRERLREMVLEENTIFIFMTDNGSSGGCSVDTNGYLIEGFNANMRGMKASPYEGGHRVPFFLRWPAGGYRTSMDVRSLTANVDFLPTILDLCGVEPMPGLPLDGKSLRPLMDSEAPDQADRIIVTDSQRVPQPIKWKDSCAMKGSWRLINGKELYDVAADPEQRRDLAKDHHDIVDELRAGYENWWTSVSTRFDEDIPISVGAAEEPVTRISSHDWRGDVGDVAWNQGEVRAGKVCNSYVELKVERTGRYAFVLRRWPREENLSIREGIAGEMVDWWTGGAALDIREARIQVGDQQASRSVDSRQTEIEFVLDLNEGQTKLRTWLIDADGKQRGAYYVYVTLVGDALKSKPGENRR